MLLQQQGSRVEVARPQVFSGKIEKVSTFINAARLYIRMKMTEEYKGNWAQDSRRILRD